MLLTINRDILLKPLTLISGFVEKKQTMPILSNVYIKKIGSEINIIANDLEIQLSIIITNVESSNDFTITLPGKKLQDILKAIPENTEIKLIQHGAKININAGKLKYSIQSLPADHYPLLKLNQAPLCELKLEQAKLKSMLNQIQYAMADRDSRVFLNGTFFEIKNNQLRLVATDAHRLALISTNLNESLPNNGLIIPRKTILELSKILEDNTQLVNIKIYNNQVSFEVDHKQLITKVIDGKYPEYERVIPLNNDKLCIINRLEFLRSVERVAIIGMDKIKTLNLNLNKNSMTIMCRNEEQDESIDEVIVNYDYENPVDHLTISFNLSYIREMLNNSNAENITLALFDASRSVLITNPHDASFKAVVMPLRA